MNAPIKFDDPTKFDWWQAALRGEKRPITEDPMTGYYRARRKNKQTGEERLYAVAYWWHQGKCYCKVNNGATLTGEELSRMIGAWPYVSKEPIKYDVWKAVVEEGKPWPDQHVVEKAAPAAEASAKPLDATSAQHPQAGAADHSKPVDESPQGLLRRTLDLARGGVGRYVNEKGGCLIDSDDLAGAAQELRSTFLKIATSAKKAREEANRPHNEAIRANGKIWSPIEDEAQKLANALRDGPLKDWEKFKRAQADAAAKAAQAAGAPIASNAPAPKATIKGSTGRTASVTETKKAVIIDQDAVYRHFRDNEQVKAILQGLANGAVRAGLTVPGTKEEKDIDIR